jgi:hypothetical protein
MKKTTLILEIAYAIILSVFFYFYAETRLEYSDDQENYTILFIASLFLILATEWVRRQKLKETRPQYEKYFFIPTMFLVLLFGMYYINSLTSGY